MSTKRSPGPDPNHDTTGAESDKPSFGHAWSLVSHRLRLRLRNGVLVIVLALAVIIPGGSVVNRMVNPAKVDVTSQSVPIQAPVPVKATTMTQLRTAFGPWRLSSSGISDSPHVLILSGNGSVESGAKSLSYDASWQNASALQINASEKIDGGLRIQFGSNHIATVGYGQVFLFEDAPEKAYSFTPDGTLLSRPIATLLEGK